MMLPGSQHIINTNTIAMAIFSTFLFVLAGFSKKATTPKGVCIHINLASDWLEKRDSSLAEC